MGLGYSGINIVCEQAAGSLTVQGLKDADRVLAALHKLAMVRHGGAFCQCLSRCAVLGEFRQGTGH